MSAKYFSLATCRRSSQVSGRSGNRGWRKVSVPDLASCFDGRPSEWAPGRCFPSRQRKGEAPDSVSGFTLLEVLLVALLLALLAGGVLQSAVLLGRHYDWTVRQRERAIEKWNTSRQLRLRKSPSAARIVPVAGARELYRHRIEGAGSGLSWEVWVGEY